MPSKHQTARRTHYPVQREEPSSDEETSESSSYDETSEPLSDCEMADLPSPAKRLKYAIKMHYQPRQPS
jgi:hypothetical protein